MSNSVIQVCYLGVLKPNKIYTDLEDPIEVKFLGESAEVNMNYEKTMVYVVAMEDDDHHNMIITSASELESSCNEFYSLMESMGFEIDMDYDVKKIVNFYYNGSDNPINLLKIENI